QQRSRGPTCRLALRHAFQHGADGGILEVAPLTLASGIACKQGLRGWRLQRKTHDPLVSSAEIRWRWKLRHRPRRCRHAGGAIELDELVPVRREDEEDVVRSRSLITLRLVEPMARRQRVLLGFDERYGDGLRFLTDANAEGVVGPSTSAATSLAADDLD